MLKTTILVCALAIAPADCTPATALTVLAFPPQRAAICGLSGQATLARMALKPEPGTSYAKTTCERVADDHP